MTGISDGTAPRSLHLGDDLHLACDDPFLHSFCLTALFFPFVPAYQIKTTHNVLRCTSYSSRSPTALCPSDMLQQL
jgi:hypothetical protein